MITGLYTCMADSIPQICITGQAPTSVLHKEAFQAVDIVEIVEIMCERETNTAMGLFIDKINEYEPILDGVRETAGQVVGGIPEGD